jgi:anti-sigma regulatory factor (Ser/Thr protein kinase)
MHTDTAAHSMCCRLSREAAQVRRAPEKACKALADWCLGEQADLAELIVGELATNAIRHGEGLHGGGSREVALLPGSLMTRKSAPSRWRPGSA